MRESSCHGLGIYTVSAELTERLNLKLDVKDTTNGYVLHCLVALNVKHTSRLWRRSLSSTFKFCFWFSQSDTMYVPIVALDNIPSSLYVHSNGRCKSSPISIPITASNPARKRQHTAKTKCAVGVCSKLAPHQTYQSALGKAK